MKRYNPKDIEPKWQKDWADKKLYQAIDFDKRSKFVMLTEFPYPSGDGLHLGHVREYTLGDIIARRQRMAGKNVLYPMGFDAFGLPTENYAIKNKIAPQLATKQNVGNFLKQFHSLGYGIDWERSFCTTDPSFYKWTQWLFLQFYKAGLAYQDEVAINWCPKCKTGLANEEVVNGLHERCDTPVEKKFLKQWILKITEYAERLIEGLEAVDYPSRIADQQVNWIGRSVGAEISFKVGEDQIKVFTTRPDTLFGATYMVLAPEHPLVASITQEAQKENVELYVEESSGKTELDRQVETREKTGVFTGAYAINPINNQQIPIWLSDYVLMSYGTGAIMAVPAHDPRDWDFARKFDLPIVRVIKNKASDNEYTTDEGAMINSGEYDGMPSQEAREKIVTDLHAKGVATERINYKLRDWIFSRQHYWGEPIPIIHCETDGAVPVPDNQLPVELPPVDHYEPTDTGESPLAEISSWVNVDCPKCGKPAKRETDTMPNWAGSSWYYLRYFDSHNDKEFADGKKLDYWGEVDLYLGGMEHTTLHLLYSRFWHQFFYDQKLVPTPEPYLARRGQGIILAEDGSKMSKSKGNVVNPSDIINQGYGADSLRLALAFLAPYDQTTPWSPDGVAGTFRFLQRFWTLTQQYLEANKNDYDQLELQAITHHAIKKVSGDIEKLYFNTAIATLMQATNELYKLKSEKGFSDAWQDSLVSLTKLLAPFAPHLCEEIWQDLGQRGSIHTSSWPIHDEKYLKSNKMTIVVQINGKLRGEITVSIDADKESIIELAKNDEKVAIHVDRQKIRKVVYVPNKLVNFVV